MKTKTLVVKSNLEAIKLLFIPSVALSGMLLSLNSKGMLYVGGQIIGALFFVQAFILMHEFGHNSFFKNKALNTFFGHLISFFTLIPFVSWRNIHHLHHKWTGWRDKDPTTEKTFDDRLGPFQIWLVDFCWRWNIPLFTLGYRFGIYWKLEKLRRHLSQSSYRQSKLNMLVMLAVYALFIGLFGDKLILALPALLLSFVFTDILSLSQHSHIRMPVSEGRNVEPMSYRDQIQYTRSLEFPGVISKWILFNFNLHEHHHAYPGLPCYHLDKVNVDVKNSFKFWPWLKKVKAVRGSDFVFKTSKEVEF